MDLVLLKMLTIAQFIVAIVPAVLLFQFYIISAVRFERIPFASFGKSNFVILHENKR